MIVQLTGTHVALTDERYAFVMDTLDRCFQSLRRIGQGPLSVDVVLEKTVGRAPRTRRGERLYRAEVEVTVRGRSIRANGGADDLQRAILRMKQHLTEEIQSQFEHASPTRRVKKNLLEIAVPDGSLIG